MNFYEMSQSYDPYTILAIYNVFTGPAYTYRGYNDHRYTPEYAEWKLNYPIFAYIRETRWSIYVWYLIWDLRIREYIYVKFAIGSDPLRMGPNPYPV